MKYSLTDIRSDVGHRSRRAEFEHDATRKHFVSKQDIANMRMKVKDLTVIRHKEDAVSVNMFVSELQEESYNPILLYKQQHETDPNYPILSKESFVFAIQTEFQKNCFQQYASKIVCVDATHGTNAYNFKLITVMVCDEFGQGTYVSWYRVYAKCIIPIIIGYPIAWCIADQENTDVVLLLFKSIKERSPSTMVNVLMSDDGKFHTIHIIAR